MDTVNQIHPKTTLQHLLSDCNISPKEKVTRLLGLWGVCQKDMARELKRNPVYLNEVLAGKRVSRPLKQQIAAFFGLEVTDLWPIDQA